MTQYTKVWQLLEDEERWCKGIWPNEAWCLKHAIDHVYGMKGVDGDRACGRVRMAIKQNSIVRWNDAPARTHAEVLALCKELDI